MYRSLFIANQFILRARQNGRGLTPMQVQKLVYFAHAIHLANTGRALIDEPFFAYPFGPVAKHLYDSLRNHGREAVDVIPNVNEELLDEIGQACIDIVYRELGDRTAMQLSDMSHVPGGPWEQAWNIQEFMVINDVLIREFYS